MTSGFLSRRLALLATLATSALVLAACGGSDDDNSGSTSLRAINLSTDVASLDLYTGDTKQFSALNSDTLAPSVSLSAGTYTVNVKRAGDTVSLMTGQYSLNKDLHYVAVVWGRESALRVSTLPEDENTNDISAGSSKLRMFNATIDSGSLDIFLTSPNGDLVTPTQGALTAGSLSGFREISAGTYRLRVTGVGNPDDVRLDIPAITLTEKQYATLVITASGTSGVLLNGTLIAQQGAKTTVKNTKARVRLAASVANGGIVNASVGGAQLFTGYLSPRYAPLYKLVESGSQTLGITVNGSPVTDGAGTLTFNEGADYTVLVYGPANASRVVVMTDDNRLPTTTGKAKIRVINGLHWTDLVTVNLNNRAIPAASDIPPGALVSYGTVDSAGSNKLEVLSTSTSLYTEFAPSGTTLLSSQGVYTLFLLDGNVDLNGRPSPRIVNVQDR